MILLRLFTSISLAFGMLGATYAQDDSVKLTADTWPAMINMEANGI